MATREKHIEYSSNVVRTLNPSISPREAEFDNKIGKRPIININISSCACVGDMEGVGGTDRQAEVASL